MVEYIKDYYNNTSIINYTKSDIQILLIILLFISCLNPCFPLIKEIYNSCKGKYNSCKGKYNIFKLPLYKIVLDDNLLLDECSICLENYKINDKIINLNCNHKFHKDCLKLWIKKNNTCPQCRENII